MKRLVVSLSGGAFITGAVCLDFVLPTYFNLASKQPGLLAFAFLALLVFPFSSGLIWAIGGARRQG